MKSSLISINKHPQSLQQTGWVGVTKRIQKHTGL